MKQTDVLIVGGGIIGTAVAYYLTQKQNMSVTMLEAETFGFGASSKAGGMLGAHSELSEFGQVADFALKSQLMWFDLAEQLRKQTGIDIELRNEPLLTLVYSEVEKANILAQGDVEWLDVEQVQELVPEVSPEIIGGVLMPLDQHVTPGLATQAFASAARLQGADLQEFTRVLDIKQIAIGYEVVATNEVYHAQKVVIASGVWADEWLKKFGLSISIFPVKGEVIALKNTGKPLRATLFYDQYWLVPRNDNEIVLGATKKVFDSTRHVTADGVATLLEIGEKMLPSVRQMTFKRSWSGLRPQTVNHLPIIGQHAEFPGLFFSAGHGRNGILLAPATGALIRDLIFEKQVNEHWLASFRLER